MKINLEKILHLITILSLTLYVSFFLTGNNFVGMLGLTFGLVSLLLEEMIYDQNLLGILANSIFN